MSNQEYQTCMELMAYMLTSAAALGEEPKIYGPLRLVEAAQRLGQIMSASAPENQKLRELLAVIEDGKHKTMSDEAGFYEMLQTAVIRMADCI